jgi:hypothetical protein
MSRKNTSSVDTTDGDKIARRSNENKNTVPVSFNQKNTDEQVVNARKGVNVDLAKAKAKIKAKMKKASQKKNKKK